jgi:hypothetical protein
MWNGLTVDSMSGLVGYWLQRTAVFSPLFFRDRHRNCLRRRNKVAAVRVFPKKTEHYQIRIRVEQDVKACCSRVEVVAEEQDVAGLFGSVLGHA